MVVVLVVPLRGVEVQVCSLEGRIEPDLGDGHCRVGIAIAGCCIAWCGYHMLALEAAAVDTGREGTNAVPW